MSWIPMAFVPVVFLARSYLTVVVLALGLAMAGCDNGEEQEAAFMQAGFDHVRQGNLEKAALDFKSALQINPKQLEALYQLALIDEQHRELRAAFHKLRVVHQEKPRHIGALVKLGQLYLFGGDNEKAETFADKLLELEPLNSDALALRGAVLLRQRALQAAKEHGERALEINPKNIGAISLLAGYYHEIGNEAGAFAVVARGLAAQPTDINLRLLKLKLLLDQDAPFQAIRAINEELITLQPNNHEHRLRLAKQYVARGELAAAETVLRSAIQDKPQDEDLKSYLINFLVHQRDMKQAIEEAKQFALATPDNFRIRFDLAGLYLQSEANNEAESVYLDIIAKDQDGPSTLAAKVALAQIRLAENRADQATAYLDDVFSQDPRHRDALLLRANMAMIDGNFGAAITDLRVVLGDSPQSKPALQMLATAFMRTGDLELAAEYLWLLSDADPGNSTARIQLAEMVLRQGNINTAENILENVLERSPGLIAGLRLLAEIHLARGKGAAAIETAHELGRAGATDDSVQFLLGRGHMLVNQNEEALRAFKQANRLAPEVLDYMAAAMSVLVAQQDWERAEQWASELIEGNPSAAGYFVRGELLAYRGRRKEAVSDYQTAIQRRPGWAAPSLRLGAIYLANGALDAAIATYRTALETTTRKTKLEFALAMAFTRKGAISDAIQTYSAVLQREHDQDVAANNLAVLVADFRHDNKQDLDLALRYALRFQTSEKAAYLDTLGWVYTRLENRNQALIYLKRAAELDPDNPQILYHLGATQFWNGQVDQAETSLSKALKSGQSYTGKELAASILANIKR